MEARESKRNFAANRLFNVHGKVALISGGGSGIGLMAAQTLAANGAKVYITGRTSEKLDRAVELYSEAPGQIVPIAADVTSKDSIKSLLQQFSAKEKALHILINNAGITTSYQNTELRDPSDLSRELFENEKSTFDEWDRSFRSNVSQVFFMTTAFLPLLQKGTELDHGWSSTVINISSVSGIIKVSQHHFPYNASKAAAVHLTKMLAHQIVSSGLQIRVNSIAPGVFPSEMTVQVSEKQESVIPKEQYEGKVPAGRPGNEEDMASVVLFAATNQYLNAQTLAVDGGYILAAGSF
ncbi:hypothetical protein MPDQ_005261 [Monascus purpureus]|uniref:Uncharacterized protein n=1 Tax=Monascus purpureus TaxID=5098 RepID=A0A507QGA9_MONPU|nr:hypothetical protein MPDQ_005261 [Monascus purpureus]BDD58354.1 hypothetical protein MAP00_003637 [Monascus purpureus]